MRKINLKYENIYLIIAIMLVVIQIVEHIKNNITIANLIIEIVLFSVCHLLMYSYIHELRQNKKTIAPISRKK